MATERFVIEITAPGAAQAASAIERIGQSASKTAGILSIFRSALVTLAIASQLRGLFNLADTFTNARNRIGVFTTTAIQTTAVLDSLTRVANETRTSFDATADVYTRLARAAAGTGRTFEQVIDNTRTLNQLIAISGATTTEGTNALIQFSQGLASGALQGEELRAVSEQLPALAAAIGREFGVSGAQLIKLNKQSPGIITTEIALRALDKAASDVNITFQKTVPTFGQVFALANTVLTIIADKFNQATGFSQALSDAMIFLAENIDAVIGVVVRLGELLITYFVAPRIIGGILAIVGALRTVISVTLTGFAAVTAAIRTSIAALATFRASATAAAVGAALLRGVMVGIGLAIQVAIGAMIAFAAAVTLAFGGAIAIAFVFQDQLLTGANATQTWGDRFRGLGDVILDVFGGTAIGEFLGKLVQGKLKTEDWNKALNAVIDTLGNILKSIIKFLIEFSTFVDTVVADILSLFKLAFEATLNLFTFGIAELSGLTDIGSTITEGFKNPIDEAAKSGAAFEKQIDVILKKLDEAAGKRQALREAGELTPQERINRENAKARQLQSSPQGLPPKDLGDGGQAAAKLAAALKALDNLQKGLGPAEKIADTVNDVARAIENAAKAGAKNLPNLEELTKRNIDKVLGLRDASAEFETQEMKLNEQLRQGIINQQQFNVAMDIATKERDEYLKQGERLLAQYDPMLANQLALNDLQTQYNELINKGAATEAQKVAATNALIRQQAGLSTAAQDYAVAMAAVNNALATHNATAEEAADRQRDLAIEFLNTQKTIGAGLQAGLLELQKDYENVGQQVKEVLKSTFTETGELLTDFFAGGLKNVKDLKKGFEDLAESILKQLTQIAIQQVILQPLVNMLSGIGGTGTASGGGGGLGGILSGIFGGGGGGGIGGIFSSIFGSIFGGGGGAGAFPGVPSGFAFDEGADFTVGGRTGRDNNLLMARVSRGERVQITPVGKPGLPGEGRITVNFNVQTPDADSFRKSQGQLMAEAAAALQRAQRRNG